MRQGPYKNNLKKMRESVMSQIELANKLKSRGFSVTPSYICQIEAGLKHIPYGLAVAICEELNYSASKVIDIFPPSSFTGSEKTLDEQSATLDKIA